MVKHQLFNRSFYLVGCLQSFVTDKDKNGPLLFDKVVDFSYQLFSALDFLHSNLRILHRDIKRMFDHDIYQAHVMFYYLKDCVCVWINVLQYMYV